MEFVSSSKEFTVDAETRERRIEELLEEISAIGITAELYGICDDDTRIDTITRDVIEQILNIYEYASFDKKFEMRNEEFFEILRLNMRSKVSDPEFEVIRKWADDLVFQVVVGAITLPSIVSDGTLIKIRDETDEKE